MHLTVPSSVQNLVMRVRESRRPRQDIGRPRQNIRWSRPVIRRSIRHEIDRQERERQERERQEKKRQEKKRQERKRRRRRTWKKPFGSVEEAPREALPYVPEDRRPLTPSPSCADLNTSGSANAPFFRLPWTLREDILSLAFGRRTVHMDLTYGHPPLSHPKNEEDTTSITHGNLCTNPGSRLDAPMPVNLSLPKQWHWTGSVCHRNPPNPPLPGFQIQPHRDQCRFGQPRYTCCESWPGDMPDKCFIGAMGWLLSCRHAYVIQLALLAWDVLG